MSICDFFLQQQQQRQTVLTEPWRSVDVLRVN